MDVREKLRIKMIENAAEINRLHGRIHETVKRRSESEKAKQEWSRACGEFHAKYEELCLPGGPYTSFYERILAGDPRMIEVALCFLEVRPYFFRSGYHWKTIIQKCKRAPMTGDHAERFATLLQKYAHWRNERRASSKAGATVRKDLVSLELRFFSLFPIKLPDHQFENIVTAGDLYRTICKALKIDPRQDWGVQGVVRKPHRAMPQADMALWAREYRAWRESLRTPQDVWATLVSLIKGVYKLEDSAVITTETILRDPRT